MFRALFFFLLFSRHTLNQQPDRAFAFFDFADFGAWGEDAEGGVDGDFFYCWGFGDGFGGGLGFGEVEAGDLEAVEEQAGALGARLRMSLRHWPRMLRWSSLRAAGASCTVRGTRPRTRFSGTKPQASCLAATT